VLDNREHVVEAIAEMAEALLRADVRPEHAPTRRRA
jgi:predicted ATPase